MNTQGLLFSEPSIAETGVWCRLNEDIDPAEWAKLCRHIGQMDAADFYELKMVLMGFEDPRATLWDKLKSVFTGDNMEKLIYF